MNTQVFFFGGFQAKQTDMNLWLGSARAQKADGDFHAFPWPPGAGAGSKSAIAAFSQGGRLDTLVDEIKISTADVIYVVGHSSGCAIANAVVRKFGGGYDRVALVALDGFAPDRGEMARSNTQVWAATCGDVTSLNHDVLHDALGSVVQDYKATACTSKWALHFSLVNSAASDRTVTSIDTGYANCRANLMWM